MLHLSHTAGKLTLLAALAVTLFASAPAGATPRRGVRAEPELRVLHVLMVIDIQKESERPRREADLRNVKAHLEGGIPAERLDLTLMQADQVNPRAVLQAVRALNVGPEDGLLFWYSGHGAYAGDDHILAMNGGELLRSQLLEELKKKNAGLTLLLTSCCSGQLSGTVPPVELHPRPRPRGLNPLFGNLFFQQRGLVDVTAAKRGTLAWGDGTVGSVFCAAFCNLLDRAPETFDTDGDGFVNWAEFYTALHEETNRVFQERKKVWGDIDQESQYADAFTLPQPVPQLGGAPRYRPAYRLGVRVELAGKGVRVMAVVPGSAADRAGLEPGDLILSVNGRPARSLPEYARLIDAAPDGRARLEILDGRSGRLVVRDVTLDRAR